MRSLTDVLLSLRYYRIHAPSGEITHSCSTKFKVSSHPMHLLVRSLTGVLLSITYHHIQCFSGEITLKYSAKYKVSHPRHRMISLTGVLLSIRYSHIHAPSGEITHRRSNMFKKWSHPRHLIFCWDHSQGSLTIRYIFTSYAPSCEITHKCSA